MEDEVVLQTHGEAEGICVDARDFLTHHHAVSIVRLACAAILLVDLQRIDTGLGRAGEHRPVDPSVAVPIMLVRNHFPGQELPHRFPVSLVVGPVQLAAHS
jgi:hypothetical protein